MPTDARYDALLLDFGGVCLLNPVEMHSVAEERLGLSPGSLDWLGPIDPSTDPLWQNMTAERMTEPEYWAGRAAQLAELSGRELSLQDYMTLLFDPPTPDMVRPEAKRVAAAAQAAGYGVSVLTNDMRSFHGRTWEHGVEFLQTVDHIVDCSDTGILKPDPRAFHRAAEITGVDLERMLFVDDQPRNVAGAEAVGLDAMWFDIANAADAWTDVARRLGV